MMNNVLMKGADGDNFTKAKKIKAVTLSPAFFIVKMIAAT
jgi:hypothetical protein